jgi:hypothetical protein
LSSFANRSFYGSNEEGLGTMDLKNQSMQLNFRSEIFERKRKVPLVRVGF